MANIGTILKNGEVFYPITSTSCLVDSNGQQFQPAKEGESYTKEQSIEVKALAQHDANAQYDASLTLITSGTNLPTTSSNQYGTLLTLPYRKARGNTTPDFAGQIFLPNGDDSVNPNSMFYRTGNRNAWNKWNEIQTKKTWQVGYNSSSSSRGWYKFLTFNWDGRNTYANYDMYILVSSTYGNPFSGILHLNPRWDTDALASGMWVEWEWMSGDKQFTADSVKVVRSNNKVECYIYQPINDGWYFIGFSILHESRRIYQMGISYEFATVDTAPLSSVSNVWVTSTKAGNGEDFQLDTEVMTNTKWINGKPIYRLTKLVSLPDSSSWQNLFYLHSSGTINQIIKIEGLLHEGNNYISLPVGEGGVYRNLRWKADTGYIQSVNNGFNGDAYITVYFTRN